MKLHPQHLIPAVLAVLICSGCANIDPNADPIVVSGERSIGTAFATVDTFLKVESENRGLLQREAPAAVEFAEQLRLHYPALHREAVALLELYKRTKNPADGDAVAAKLELIEAIARQAQKYIGTVKASRTNA